MRIKSGLSGILENNRRWFIFTIVILAIGMDWTFASRSTINAINIEPPQYTPKQGFTAPDFTLDLMGGGHVTLTALHGKVVLVNLWASWCPPCRAEMPAIEKVYRSFKPQGFEVLAVNATNQDNEPAAAAFVQELGLTFPIPLDHNGDVSTQYGMRGLPSSFIIDRKGIIRSVVVGPMSEALLQSKVEELLKEPQ
jgi:cytochrome c biogenesis protein CcmG, thiol:disulfide interchange protein DsbE